MKIKVAMKSPVATVEPGTTVAQAETLLAAAETRGLPVVEGRRLVGMVYRRDLLRLQPSTVPALARYELAYGPSRLCVRDVMRSEVVAVAPDADVQEAARMLSGREAEALPVVDGGEVVGLLGIHELLTVLVPELERRWPPRLRRVLAAVGTSDRTPPALPAALALARRHRARRGRPHRRRRRHRADHRSRSAVPGPRGPGVADDACESLTACGRWLSACRPPRVWPTPRGR